MQAYVSSKHIISPIVRAYTGSRALCKRMVVSSSILCNHVDGLSKLRAVRRNVVNHYKTLFTVHIYFII